MNRAGMALAGAFALACTLGATAQDDVVTGAYQFSDGVHPTFDASFGDPGGREVSRFWLGELKGISMKVANRKEMSGAVARIPSASPDTMRILVAIEKPRGKGLYTTAHLAFLTTNGYVGPDSPERELNGCMEWVRQRALALRRQLAQGAVDQGERQLALLEREFDLLKREEQRGRDNIHRTEQRIERAVRGHEEAGQQLRQLAADTTAPDTAARPAMDKERMKQERLWQDRAKRSTYTRQGLEKKLQDLQWDLTRNGKEQAAKQAEIQRQQATVEELREKLRAVH